MHNIVLKFICCRNPTVTVQTGLITSSIATLDLIFFLAFVGIYSMQKQRVSINWIFLLQPSGLYVLLFSSVPR